ncbi:glutaredoxin family protein [Shouchella shacheensis]|uniref:glutaredoxin family protein n=1 Tax=Shouchella shacheensis TaxID=1649580 RepID=UPI0007400B62|nr:glutaredoxin family protein [Shouchella shacheensis]
MSSLTFYTKKNCPLCEKGYKVLQELQADYSFRIETVDIYEQEEFLEAYQLKIPVITAGGKELDYGLITREKLEPFLAKQK